MKKIIFLDSVFVMTAIGVQKIQLSCTLRLWSIEETPEIILKEGRVI